jgi:photosystem II stability/assembly factor-like uncharacterized protein
MKILIYILTFIFLPLELLYPQWKLLGLENENVKKILTHPNVQNTIYAGSAFVGTTSIGGFFVSTDLGITWDTLITGISVTDFVIDYQDPDIIYVALGLSSPTGTGIIKSTDGGNNWFDASNGIFISWEIGLYPIAIDLVNPDVLYCGTLGPMGGNLYKTTNGGQYWFIPSADSFLFDIGVAVIEFDPYNTSMLYVGRARNGKLFRSIDGGVNFEFAGYENGGGIKILKFGRNSDEIYVTSFWSFAYPAGIFRTKNGGTNWQNIGEGFNGRVDVGDVALNFTNKDYIYIGAAASDDTSGVYVKVDSSSWALIGLNDKFINSLTIYNEHLWAGIYGGIYARDLISHVEFEQDYYSPNDFTLLPAYPNPFNNNTNITYYLQKHGKVKIEIINLLGKKVKLITEDYQHEGGYTLFWNGKDNNNHSVASGIYLVKFQFDKEIKIQKIILLK